MTNQGRWLGQVVRGYLTYHPVPTNSQAIAAVRRLALEAGARASQPKGPRELDTDGADCRAVAAARQGPAPICATMLHLQTPEVGAECVSSARWDLSGGRGVTRVPTGMGAGRGQEIVGARASMMWHCATLPWRHCPMREPNSRRSA